MSGFRRAVGIGLMAAAGLFLAPHDMAAASCPPAVDVATALGEATSVFVGEVASVEDQDRVATMDVLSVWKGPDLPEQVEVRGAPAVGSPVGPDDRRFTVGKTYLVIPENTRRPFLASNCSAISAFSDTGVAIPAGYQEAVGATTGRAPVTPVPESETAGSGVPLGLLAIVGAVPVAVGAAVLVRRRRAPTRRRLAELIPELPDDAVEKQEHASRWHRLSIAGLGRRLFRRSGMRRVASLKRHH